MTQGTQPAPNAPAKKPPNPIYSLLVLLVFVAGVGSLYYFGVYSPKHKQQAEQSSINAQDHSETVPLDEKVVDQGKLEAPTKPGRYLWVHSKGRTVVELTPGEVKVGSVDDWRGLDADSKAKLASKTLYYVKYQLTYVNGDAIPGYIPPGIRLSGGGKESEQVTILQMSGFKQKANQSGCESPNFTGTFGKGSTLPSCDVVSLPKGTDPTELLPRPNLDKDPQPKVSWPVTVQQL